jgi:hypothetical protein
LALQYGAARIRSRGQMRSAATRSFVTASRDGDPSATPNTTIVPAFRRELAEEGGIDTGKAQAGQGQLPGIARISQNYAARQPDLAAAVKKTRIVSKPRRLKNNGDYRTAILGRYLPPRGPSGPAGVLVGA